MKYFTAIVLYIFFWLTAALSGPYGLLAVLWDRSIISRVLQTNDRTAAAMLPFGWGGHQTISKECGDQLKAGNPCRFCRVVCRVLDRVLKMNHCLNEAN